MIKKELRLSRLFSNPLIPVQDLLLADNMTGSFRRETSCPLFFPVRPQEIKQVMVLNASGSFSVKVLTCSELQEPPHQPVQLDFASKSQPGNFSTYAQKTLGLGKHGETVILPSPA